MPGSLGECWGKFNWAKRHTDALDGMITFWLTLYGRTASFQFRKEFNPRTNCFSYRMTGQQPIFIEVALMVGDIVANYRAALDYLALILVDRGRTPCLTPSALVQVQFPIYSDRLAYNAALERRLPGVRKQHRAIIRRHQPYHRGKRAFRDALAILADLSNKDKHRKLQRSFGRVYQFRATIRETQHFTPTKVWVPAVITPDVGEGKTKFLKIWGVPDGTGQPEVKMNFAASATITFDNGLRIDAALTAVSRRIARILGEFEPLL
jgi:hypothetical protein